jgi:CBS domain-containing protein
MKTAKEILGDKIKARLVSVAPDATLAAAIGVMVEANIGAILVEENNEIVGIWSERDLLRLTNQPGFDPKDTLIRDHMKTNLHCAAHNTPLIKLEEMFLGLFIRHILVKRGEKTIGLLSIGDVMRTSLLEKDSQIKELNSIASWQYYENWGWDKKK